eukprot:1142391-Amphidinium_carterae.1
MLDCKFTEPKGMSKGASSAVIVVKGLKELVDAFIAEASQLVSPTGALQGLQRMADCDQNQN